MPGAPTKPGTQAKKPIFQSVAEFLRTAYGSKRKHLAITNADLKAMQAVSKPDAQQRKDLLLLAASDRTLERSRELLLLSIDKFAHHSLAGWVGDFAREALQQHPVYQSPALRSALQNLPDAPSLETAIATIAAQPFADLKWPEGTLPLKKSQVETLRLTAVHCFLLSVRGTHGISLARIHYFVHSACWPSTAEDHKNEGRILRTLMLARDRKALGISFSMLEQKVAESVRDVAAARAAEERTRAAIGRLQSELAMMKAQFESERSRNEDLNQRREHELRNHEDEKVQMRNDYEELRGRILRRLREEVALLDDGLQALRKQPPKVHVMNDHAERAIDGLRREIERIKEQNQ
jgi:hypothetical protein